MCGPSTSSSSGTSNIVAGGRGSNIAEKKKSKTEMAIGQGISKFAGSLLGGAIGGVPGSIAGSKAFSSLASSNPNTTIDLRTGKSTAGPGAGASGDENTARVFPLLSADTKDKEAAATATAATAKAAEDKKAKAAALKNAGGTKTKTVLAGAKIAEEKLKTKLGQ